MKHTGVTTERSADADAGTPVLDLTGELEAAEADYAEGAAILADFAAWARSYALTVARRAQDRRARALWLGVAVGRISGDRADGADGRGPTAAHVTLAALAFRAFVAAAALEAQRANDDRRPEPTRLPPPPPLQDVHILAAPAPANAPPAGDLPTLREVAT